MWLLLIPLKLRYMLLCIALLGFTAVIAGALRYPNQASLLAAPLAFFAFFSILGLRDFFQTRHAILRNYPITAHLRFLFEKIRPEMRQYFFEDDKTGLHFTGATFGVFGPSGIDPFHRRIAPLVGRQTRRLQALRRAPMGVYGHRQGDARDRYHTRFHC